MASEHVVFEIGPVSSRAAVAWIASARADLEAVAAADDLPFRIPDDVLDVFRGYLRAFDDAATTSAPFRYAGSADAEEARRLLTYWLNITSLTSVQRERAGLTPAPPEAAPMARAIARAILTAGAGHAELAPVAAFLRRRREV